jgi:hypothetical protein
MRTPATAIASHGGGLSLLPLLLLLLLLLLVLASLLPPPLPLKRSGHVRLNVSEATSSRDSGPFFVMVVSGRKRSARQKRRCFWFVVIDACLPCADSKHCIYKLKHKVHTYE